MNEKIKETKLQSTQFLFEAASAGRKSLNLLEESERYTQPVVGADVYNTDKIEAKLTNDGSFFAGLSSVLEESSKDAYYKELGLLLESTHSLFKEVNMKPRTCSQAVDTQELTESTIQGIYSKHFTDQINAEYALPLMEGTLLDSHKDEARLLTEAAIAAGLTQEVDTELFLKYAIFENSIVQNSFKMILPEVLEERTDAFINQQDEEYFEVFTKNAKALKEEITESIIKMSAMTAPKLFEEATGLKDSGVKKFAGISKALV